MWLIFFCILFVIGIILLIYDFLLYGDNYKYKNEKPKEYDNHYKEIIDSKFYRGFRLLFYVELFFVLIGAPFIIFFFLGYLLFGALFNDFKVADSIFYVGLIIINTLFITYMINRVRLRYLLNNKFNCK